MTGFKVTIVPLQWLLKNPFSPRGIFAGNQKQIPETIKKNLKSQSHDRGMLQKAINVSHYKCYREPGYVCSHCNSENGS